MDSLIETFHIDWKLMLAQGINFAIVILVLYRFALRPLMKMMDERSQTIAKGLDDAKEKEKLLGEAKEAYEATVRDARTEAGAILKNIKEEGEAKRAELLAKAQAEAQGVFEQGKKNLETEKDRMLADAKKEIVAMVIGATEKVLGQAAGGKIEAKLVEDSIKQL